MAEESRRELFRAESGTDMSEVVEFSIFRGKNSMDDTEDVRFVSILLTTTVANCAMTMLPRC